MGVEGDWITPWASLISCSHYGWLARFGVYISRPIIEVISTLTGVRPYQKTGSSLPISRNSRHETAVTIAPSSRDRKATRSR